LAFVGYSVVEPQILYLSILACYWREVAINSDISTTDAYHVGRIYKSLKVTSNLVSSVSLYLTSLDRKDFKCFLISW